MAYTMNLLRGKAAQWGTALLEGGSAALASQTTFIHEMRRVLSHTIHGLEAASRLISLCQRSQSAAEYSIDFAFLAPQSGWNEPAPVSSEKAVLESTGRITFSGISLVLHLDNCLRGRLWERASTRCRSTRSRPSQISHSLPALQRFSHIAESPELRLLPCRGPWRWEESGYALRNINALFWVSSASTVVGQGTVPPFHVCYFHTNGEAE